ncbi:hypothetical protein BHM03_00010617 [Ensete ventricosum]|nr:hypothetical protein BHM03_00010617 [Ensete ventricosum]
MTSRRFILYVLPFITVHDIPCLSLRTAPRFRSRSAGPLRLLVHAVTYFRTSVPDSEERVKGITGFALLSWPSSSATTTVLVANGDPSFRKVTGPAVRSKVVCHCAVVPIDELLQRCYRTLHA